MKSYKLTCCCCCKQIVQGSPSRYEFYVTKLEGCKKVVEGTVCGYCAEDLDENGLFPEERAFVKDL